MKIALKYGLLITAVVVGWIVIVRFVMDVGANSKANVIAPIIFNIAAIVAILLGIRARKNELNGALSFKEGLKTGMKISLVYAVSACLFFLIEFLVAGPKLLLSEAGLQAGGTEPRPDLFRQVPIFSREASSHHRSHGRQHTPNSTSD